MKHLTSVWFRSLDSRQRKAPVCLLFELEAACRTSLNHPLFMEFLRKLDDEYHSLK